MTAILLAGIAIVVFGDLSAFRETAEKNASLALGRPVKIAGDMSLRPSLPPLVALNDVRVGNPQWSFHDNLLHADRLVLTLSLSDLLIGDIVVDAVALESFELIIERNPEGDYNWTSQLGTGVVPLEILTLTDGVVRWVDHRDGRIVRLKSYVRIFSLLSQLRRPCLSGLSQIKHVFTP